MPSPFAYADVLTASHARLNPLRSLLIPHPHVRHRVFLEGFRLPGEAQKIDRLMEKVMRRSWAQAALLPFSLGCTRGDMKVYFVGDKPHMG